MAERRMFSKTIIDSDVFLDMPLSTQALYFHISMRADDDGFVNNPKKIMRIIGANQNDLDILLAKRYFLPFPSGILVVKHWRMHNYIQKDRYKETVYLEEKNQLILKDNKSYTEAWKDGYIMDTDCIQGGYTGKVRLELEEGKNRQEEKKQAKKESPVLSDSPFQPYIPEDRDYAMEFEQIRNHWNSETGKDERKTLFQFSNSGKIKDRMEPYETQEIMQAINNFSKHPDFKKLNYSLPGFLETGISTYLNQKKDDKKTKYEEIIL